MFLTSVQFCALLFGMLTLSSGQEYWTNVSECKLSTKIHKNASRIIQENRLIKFELDITGDLGPLSEKYPSGLLNPKEWILLTEEAADILLLLPDNYVQKSLYALSFHVAHFHMSLNQTPENCFANDKSVSDIMNIIRNFIQNITFENSKVNKNFQICNRFIKVSDDDNNTADLQYECCNYETDTCKPLEPSVSLQRFNNCLTYIAIIVWLFCPLFIPKSFCRLFNSKFKCHGSGLLFPKIKITKTRQRDQSKQILQLDESFDKFKQAIKDMRCDEQIFQIKAVYINVNESELVFEGSHPFRLLEFLYTNFIRCGIRKYSSHLNECFQTNIFKLCQKKICKESRACNCSWLSCTQPLMAILMFMALTCPWWLIVIFYYAVNKTNEDYVKSVGTSLNITITLSSRPSLTRWHHVGITVIFITFCLYKTFTIIQLYLKTLLDFPLKVNRTCCEPFSAWLAVVLKPMKKYGLAGCICYPVWLIWVVMKFLWFLFQTVPLAAVFFGLFKSLKDFININVFILLLVFAFFVVDECINFYSDCIVYIIIGLLLNFNDVFPYVSVLLLISAYGYNSFHKVDVKFFNFINILCKETQLRISDRIENFSRLNEVENLEEPENIAYILPKSDGSSAREKESFQVSQEGRLLWKASRLCSFLHKSDSKHQYYISRKFFEIINKIPHGFSPGHPFLLYLKSCRDFALVLVFLYFVITAVFALGKAHNLPSGVQTLVALGGGFLPFIMQKVFSKIDLQDGAVLTNKIWEKMLDSEIDCFKELYHVIDMDLSSAPLNSEINQIVDENILGNSQSEGPNVFKMSVFVDEETLDCQYQTDFYVNALHNYHENDWADDEEHRPLLENDRVSVVL